MKAALLVLVMMLGGCADAAISAAGQAVLGLTYTHPTGGKK